MKKLILCAAFAASLGLSGCATSPSKPLTFDQLGKFSTTPLNAQTYRISFQAIPNMSYGTAEEITLLKAAQATVQNGFQFFKVNDDPSNRTQQPPRKAVVYPTPMPYPYGYYRRHPAFWPDPFYDMPQVVTLDPVQVSYTIECYKNQKTAPQDAFDARLILQSLGSKYGLSATGEVLPAPTQPNEAKKE
ncbi:CC0125/CC1285 family lipoprotein [Acinetobacter tianfuensis]|uniref:Lipoprotein n=1 Tax=Acinetobacter tianfuensis TaxID=2419603 RepID=A0A3A8EL29_9GAMM|nr:hypothetical protein [Acinetobacter tianfuensis]RKG29581.1 hypothetical protein D7V32_14265 [Acinetobacter tianfuensis]